MTQIRELHLEDNGERDPEKSGGVRPLAKMDSACTLIAKGREIAPLSRAMGVPRAQLSLRVNRSVDWQDGRGNRRDEVADADLLSRIQ